MAPEPEGPAARPSPGGRLKSQRRGWRQWRRPSKVDERFHAGKPRRSLTKELAWRGAIILLCVIAAATASYYLLKHEIGTNERTTSIVNHSGRQRLLAHQIALLIKELAAEPQSPLRPDLREQLGRAIGQMAASHRYLCHPPAGSPEARHLTPEIRRIFFEPPWLLNRKIDDYLDQSRKFLDLPAEDLTRKREAASSLTGIAYQNELLAGLDQLTRQYERDNARRMQGLLRLNIFLLAGEIALLVLLVVFVFVPFVGQHSRDEINLQDISSALDESAIVAVTDAAGEIVHVNHKFCEISEYSPEELLGQDHRIVRSGYHPKEFMRELWETIQAGRVWKGVVCNRAKSGRIYWVDTTIVPFLDDGGEPYQYIAIRADVTEKKQAEEELRVLNAGLEEAVRLRTTELERRSRELEASNEELENFAYVASHDLQEPLRMVSSYTELLARRYRDRLDQDARDFIDFATDGARRMQALIQDLLSYARVGTRGRPLAPTDLSEVLERTLRDFRITIEESGASLTHDDPLPRVMADERQLGQVFQNLIGNAIKFRGEAPPAVHVGAERRDGEWLLSVRDNGIGIGPEYSDRIFIMFQRLHGKDRYEGTGIGLAVCKKIIERHGGHIWMESQPGKGATFFFTLPAGEPEKGEAT